MNASWTQEVNYFSEFFDAVRRVNDFAFPHTVTLSIVERIRCTSKQTAAILNIY